SNACRRPKVSASISAGCSPRVQSEAGVASPFGGASAGAFGDIAFGQGLHSPNDAFDQPGGGAGFGGFAEEFGEALPQLADTEPLERRDLVDDVHFHRDAPFACWGQRSTRVDSEPQFVEKLKARRDKKGLCSKEVDLHLTFSHGFAV